MQALSLSNKNARKRAGKYDTLSVILIGLGRIIACHCFLWNTGYGVGVTPFYLINIFWSIGVICMSLCLAEMASALPFTGGVYGFARGLIGPYVGFLVGLFEFFGNLTLLGVFVIAFGQCVSTSLGLHDLYILPFILIPSGIAVTLQYAGAKRFGFVVKFLTIFCLLLFLIYVFGSFAHLSVPRYGNNPNARPPSATYKLRQVFQNSNYGTVFFVGIESLPVISSEAQKPHVSIPWSILAVFIFYCISSTAVIFLAAWQKPGTQDVQRSFVPLSFGYANIFGISDEAAAIFSAPAALTSCVVCTYYMCVTLRSMAQSGVLPSCVAKMARFRSLFCAWRSPLSAPSLPPSSEPKMNGALETVMEGVSAKEAVNEKGTLAIHTNITVKTISSGVVAAGNNEERTIELKSQAEEEDEDEEVPYVALGIVILGTAITTVMLLAGLLYYEAFALGVLIYGTYSLYALYAAIFATYLVFYFHYKDKNRKAEHFQSPIGPYGAYIGLFMTCCLIVANNYPYHPYLRNCLVIFVGSFLLFTAIYIGVMANHQRYSPEEEKVFFVAYIIRANRRQRESLRRGNHHQHHQNNNSVSLTNPRQGSSPKSSFSWSKASLSGTLRSSSKTHTNSNASSNNNSSSSSNDSTSIRAKSFQFGVIQLAKYHPQSPSAANSGAKQMHSTSKKDSDSNKVCIESSEPVVRLKNIPAANIHRPVAHNAGTHSSASDINSNSNMVDNDRKGWFSFFSTNRNSVPTSSSKRWKFGGSYRRSAATVVAHNTSCDIEEGRNETDTNRDRNHPNDALFQRIANDEQDLVIPFET